MKYLLNFRLTFARPLENAMITPKEIREANGVAFAGGDAGSRAHALREANKSQLIA